MKTPVFQVFLILLGSLVFSACLKEPHTITSHDWEFKTIHKPNGERKGTGKKYTLTFTGPASFSYNTDVNSCWGNYISGPHDHIDFSMPACTEVCCDSEFAQLIGQYLYQVTYFEIRGRNLNLKGPGGLQIDLRRR